MPRGRTRYSEGYVSLTDTKQWQAHWFPYVSDPATGVERRRHRTKILGSKSTMTKAKAKELLRELSGAPHATKDSATTLSWFIDHRWKPLREGGWRASTKQTNEELLAIIKARFGTTPLERLDKVALQGWLNELAASRSRSCVLHIRTFLKAICSEAVKQDFLVKDPTRKFGRLVTREPDATLLEWIQYQSVLARLELRDQLVVKVAAACAVRPEELFAFRWRHFIVLPDSDRHALLVEDTVHRGKL